MPQKTNTQRKNCQKRFLSRRSRQAKEEAFDQFAKHKTHVRWVYSYLAMGLYDRLKDKLGPALSKVRYNSRTGREAESLVAQTLTGTIVGLLIRVVIDAVILWSALLALRSSMTALLPAQPCVAACFIKMREICCQSDPATLLRIAGYLATLFVGSALSTLAATSRRFQHSATLSVFMLLSIVIALYRCGFTPPLLVGIAVFVFIVMFWGYRLGLVVRRMRSKS